MTAHQNHTEFISVSSKPTLGETAGGAERYTTALRPRSLLTGRSFRILKSIPELISLDYSLCVQRPDNIRNFSRYQPVGEGHVHGPEQQVATQQTASFGKKV